MRNLILSATPFRFRIARRIGGAIDWIAARDPELAELAAAAGFTRRGS